MVRDYVQAIIDEIGTWDGVSIEPHRFGGQQFNMDAVEIGHIHRNGMVDIPFTRKIREALVTEGLTEHHHILPDSGWISFYIHHAEDVQQALWLYRLSMLHKQRGRARRDEARAAMLTESLRAMHLSPQLAEAVGLDSIPEE